MSKRDQSIPAFSPLEEMPNIVIGRKTIPEQIMGLVNQIIEPLGTV